MNISLIPWLSEFHAVCYSGSSGYLLYCFEIGCYPSFSCARKQSISTYISILAVSLFHNLYFFHTLVHKSSLFSTSLSLPTLIFSLFDNSHPPELISHCGFDFHFLDNKWCWALFHVLVGHVYVYFGKKSIPVLCLSLNRVTLFFWFFAIKLGEFLIYFGYSPLIQYMVRNFFFLFCRLPFYFVDCCAKSF